MGLKCNGKKASFHDLLSANKRLREIYIHGEPRDKSPKRAYKCYCGNYHLTSLTQSEIDNFINKVNAKIKKREQSFISRESKAYIKSISKKDKPTIKKFRDNN